MVKLILRDDDWTINCKPRDLEPFVIAAKFFDEVILSFVPFPANDSKLSNLKKSSSKYNPHFIRKVREILKLGNITIAMHGLTHSGYGEFKLDIDIRKIKEGKKYLESLFGVEINTFTPPNNILSRKNFINIEQSGFSRIVSAFSNWPYERPLNFDYLIHFFLSSVLVFTNNKNKRILSRLKFKNLNEYVSFIVYNEKELCELTDSIKFSPKLSFNEIYIATHYWEIPKNSMHNLLCEVIRIRNLFNE